MCVAGTEVAWRMPFVVFGARGKVGIRRSICERISEVTTVEVSCWVIVDSAHLLNQICAAVHSDVADLVRHEEIVFERPSSFESRTSQQCGACGCDSMCTGSRVRQPRQCVAVLQSVLSRRVDHLELVLIHEGMGRWIVSLPTSLCKLARREPRAQQHYYEFGRLLR